MRSTQSVAVKAKGEPMSSITPEHLRELKARVAAKQHADSELQAYTGFLQVTYTTGPSDQLNADTGVITRG